MSAGLPEEIRRGGQRLIATFRDEAAGLDLIWSVELRDGANYVVQALELKAEKDTTVKDLVFVNAPMDGAKQTGQVDGSVVVCGDSHTSTHGAMGALAFGIGTSEVEHVLATQCLRENSLDTRLLTIGENVHAAVVGVVHVVAVGIGGAAAFWIRRTAEPW